MGQFTEFAEKFNAIAKTAFAEHADAQMEFEAAQRNVNQYPVKQYATSDYAVKAAKAAERFSHATTALRHAEMNLEETERKIESLREEFESAVAAHYSAKPAAVDHATITLLESGVMSVDEYDRLLTEAIKDGNYTMARLIGEGARRRSAETKIANTIEATKFRYIWEAAQNASSGAVERTAFKTMKDLYRRCTKNIKLREQWDYFADNTINKL